MEDIKNKDFLDYQIDEFLKQMELGILDNPKEYLINIFDQFYKLEEKTKTE